MNTIFKLGAAGALVLSYASAHAGIVASKSSSTPGDLLLFAQVVTGSTVDAYYVGDTSVAVGGATPASGLSTGTLISATGATADANLSTLLGLVNSNTTLEWAVQGAGYDAANNAGVLTTQSNAAALAYTAVRSSASPGFAVSGISGVINNTLNNLVGSGTSYEGASSTKWDATGTLAELSNTEQWYANLGATAITGYGTTSLYSVVAPSAGGYTVASVGSVTLSASGLSYAAPVPLPPAVWLLGSGLLGLAGISRRKVTRA